MTASNPAPALHRWVTASRTARSGYNTVSELLRKGAPEIEVVALFEELIKIRGVHRVSITPADNGFRTVFVAGTDRGVTGAANVVMLSSLREVDRNADHDHEACIASARKMGVPAAWAHRPETYLSM